MSCWVVPTVAAELWGLPVDTVLERARSGQIHSKSENGFTFIDVAPGGEECDPPLHPPTFASITPAELIALHERHIEHEPEDWRSARQVTSRIRKPPAQVPRVLP